MLAQGSMYYCRRLRLADGGYATMRLSVCPSVCPVTAKTPRMEKPAIRLSRVVNVARQQQRRREVTQGKPGVAGHCNH